MSDLNAS